TLIFIMILRRHSTHCVLVYQAYVLFASAFPLRRHAKVPLPSKYARAHHVKTSLVDRRFAQDQCPTKQAYATHKSWLKTQPVNLSMAAYPQWYDQPSHRPCHATINRYKDKSLVRAAQDGHRQFLATDNAAYGSFDSPYHKSVFCLPIPACLRHCGDAAPPDYGYKIRRTLPLHH